MARINFNPMTTQPFTGFSQTLPAGEYQVEIVSESEATLDNNKGKALDLNYQVLAGPYQGQRVRDRIYLWHTNPQAVQMAQSVLVAIAHAVGLQTFQDTHELHRRPFNVTLSTREYNGKEYNNFVEYCAISNQTSTPYPVNEGQQAQAPTPYWNN